MTRVGPWLSNLASSLRIRAARLRQYSDTDQEHQANQADQADRDLDEAHRLHLESVRYSGRADPDYAAVLSNLAGSFRDRYVRDGDRTDLHAAFDLLRQVAELAVAPVTRRLVAAQTWALLAADTAEWEQADRGFAAAIALLPTAAWRGVDRASREHLLRNAQWLASDAAACALQLGDPQRAIDLLERGRAVLWNQQLETAVTLDRIYQFAPELATRLEAARTVLEMSGDVELPAAGRAAGASRAAQADARIRAATEWDDAIAELRQRGDFELAELFPASAPSRFTDLPDDGVAVVLNISRYRCDAILVDRHGVRSRPLAELRLPALATQVGAYFTALATLVDQAAPASDLETADKALDGVLGWLWEAVLADVLADVLAGSGPGERVWWCPTGPLTYLPLHAAGQVPDRVVSSYTPTLTTLLRALAPPTAPHGGRQPRQRVLAVAVPRAPGMPPLPSPARELADIATALPADVELTRIEGPAARREAVRPALDTHTWVHFACHGEQNPMTPSQAALVLTDGRLRVTEIATRTGYHADGAYLSACQTALGGVELTDEVLHLAAALQYAGFRRIVATLWPVRDLAARTVSRRIYTALSAAGTFDPARSARAVRDATLWLRTKYPQAPSRWAAYVHVGP